MLLMGVEFRFCFGDDTEDQRGNNTANNRIDDKQVEEIDVRDKSANGRSDHPGEVTYHAQNAESFLSLLFGEDIGDHRVMRRMGNAG